MTGSRSQRETGSAESPRRDYPDRQLLGGEVGIWTSNLDSLPAPRAQEAVAELEELGYAALWFGEAFGREAFTNASMSSAPPAVWWWPRASLTSSSVTPRAPTPRPRRLRGRIRVGSSWGWA
jgi:hypothetical protein